MSAVVKRGMCNQWARPSEHLKYIIAVLACSSLRNGSPRRESLLAILAELLALTRQQGCYQKHLSKISVFPIVRQQFWLCPQKIQLKCLMCYCWVKIKPSVCCLHHSVWSLNTDTSKRLTLLKNLFIRELWTILVTSQVIGPVFLFSASNLLQCTMPCCQVSVCWSCFSHENFQKRNV